LEGTKMSRLPYFELGIAEDKEIDFEVLETINEVIEEETSRRLAKSDKYSNKYEERRQIRSKVLEDLGDGLMELLKKQEEQK
jgi:hypothetical protein